MSSKNIGWHTRLYADNTKKITGGSFGGELSLDTVNRLVNYHCPRVVVKASGTPVFVDRNGREVTLYVTVDARETEMGKAAISEWLKDKETKEKLFSEQQEQQSREIELLMDQLSHEDIVKRLKGLE